MSPEEIIDAMKAAAMDAINAAEGSGGSATTKAAYVRGIRAMAGLVHACGVMAQRLSDEAETKQAKMVFGGYAQALRHIVNASEDMIPKGYE